MQTIILGGGCFWCTEAVYEPLKGVISVAPGYTGGQTKDPTYCDICTGETGHAEVIRVEFDPAIITLDDILHVFFASHDPTTLNRQGNDVGTQYRSSIFYTTEEQKAAAEAFIAQLNQEGKRAVTEVVPLETFYEAEAYHHHYFQNNPDQAYCQFVINPKYEKVKAKFQSLMKDAYETK